MMLADPDAVREQLGFDNMPDVNAAIEAALHAATPILESRLGTGFDYGVHTDSFYAAEPGFLSGIAPQTSFRLSNGFVRDLTSMSHGAAQSLFPSGAADITEKVTVDSDIGVIRDFHTIYGRSHVQVAYTAGFQPDSARPDMYRQDQVPNWLREAAKLIALTQLATHPSMKAGGVELDARMYTGQVNAIIARKVRYAPTALLPM